MLATFGRPPADRRENDGRAGGPPKCSGPTPEGAPSAKPAAAANENTRKTHALHLASPDFMRAPISLRALFAKYSSRSNRLHDVHLTNFTGFCGSARGGRPAQARRA